MEYTTILTNDEGGGIFTIKLNRPERRNAISIRMWSERSPCPPQLAASASGRVPGLTGAGSRRPAGLRCG